MKKLIITLMLIVTANVSVAGPDKCTRGHDGNRDEFSKVAKEADSATTPTVTTEQDSAETQSK